MLVRKNSRGQDSTDMRDLKELTFMHLMICLEELRRQGYFYEREHLWVDGGEGIRVEKLARGLGVSEEWIKAQEEQPVTSIWIKFSHIITGEKRYIFIDEEMFEGKLQTVMWAGDGIMCGPEHKGRVTRVEDRDPLFEDVLQKSEMIIVPGKLYRLDVSELRNHSQCSLFELLYGNRYRQLREGRIEIKEDRNEEKSFAWAGEFQPDNRFFGNKGHLLLAIYRREFEEWERDLDGEMCCIWKERISDVYAGWSQETLVQVKPEGEKAIPMEKLENEKEINAYLRAFWQLDSTLYDVV